jgi:hypothetical protein
MFLVKRTYLHISIELMKCFTQAVLCTCVYLNYDDSLPPDIILYFEKCLVLFYYFVI